MKSETLVELLRIRAERQGSDSLFTFLGDGEGETTHLTFGQLDYEARIIGAQLQKSGLVGERVLLVYPAGLKFISAFFGCLYAGAVAIPVPLMGFRRAVPRLQAVLQDAEAKAILSTDHVLSKLKGQLKYGLNDSSLMWLSTDVLLEEFVDQWRPPILKNDSLAYLQYTSGSTADPKGVMVTHGNVVHNLAYIEQGCEYTTESILVSWLPHFHDMGLVNGILQPIFQGCQGILMPPQSFVQRPIRWLEAISQYQASHSGGPNFAYEMCANTISSEERQKLDLRSWILAYCGAEPVHHSTLVRFHETFQSQGFNWAAFCPAYGLAETTLKVSAKLRKESPIITTVNTKALERNQVVEVAANEQISRTLVCSGRVGFGMNVKIVNPETFRPCPSHTIGEIWVTGPSVARGYWNREQETQDTFRACLSDGQKGFFLRTGDLGFLRDDQLFVTGRLKDLIIIRGNNYYPQDIEGTVERSHGSLSHGCGAAFSIDQDGEEKLVVVQEIRRGELSPNPQKVIEDIRRAVAEEHNLHLFGVLLVRVGTIPKTSSGKVQRQTCRHSYLTGQLKVIAKNIMNVSRLLNDEPHLSIRELLTLNAQDRSTKIQSYLQLTLARFLHQNSTSFSGNDRLIALGLDSLMMFELRQNIENVFGVVLPFSMLMDGPSLAEVAQEIGSKLNRVSGDGSTSKSVRLSEPQTLPLAGLGSNDQQIPNFIDTDITDESLSHGQQGLWLFQQEDPEGDAYHIRFAARVSGKFDIHAFQRALRILIDRHPALRTTFREDEGFLRQVVREVDEGMFKVVDASDCLPEEFQTMLEEEASKPFNLESGPLIRVHIFVHAPKSWVILIGVHHLVSDLWSMSILVDELRQLYIAEKDERLLNLPSLTSSYSDFVRWQGDYLASPHGERLWNYWHDHLKGELPVLSLPADRVRFPSQNFAGATHSFRISLSLTKKLKDLAQQQDTTLYVVLLSAFQVLLARLTSQDDIIIGSPVAGRTRSEFEHVIGYFVNVLPFRVSLGDDPSFTSLIARNHHTVSQGLDHQDYPFPLMVERLALPRDPGVSPICQVMFVYERPHRMDKEGISGFILGDSKTRMNFGDVEFAPFSVDRRSSERDLSLILTEVEDRFQASFQYRSSLFNASRIERMAGHFETLLDGIVSTPTCRLSGLSVLSPSEERQVLIEWNQTQTEYPKFCSIQEVFEAQVERSPDHIAVTFQGATLSYTELNDRANQVAHDLKERGVGPEQLVGICMERSFEMVVGMLGILKLGGSYVPLDPGHPEERLRFMMEDAHLTVILTQAQFRTRLNHNGIEIICLDSEWEQIQRRSKVNPPCCVSPEGLAYVMYTSGSTGSPKGVCIPHRGVIRLVKETDYLQFNADQVFLQLAPFTADASTFEIWGALLNGARLVLYPPYQPTFDELGRVIHDNGITTMRLTADMFHRMAETDLDILTPLQQLVVGGDVLSAPHVNRAIKALPNCKLVNGYGPTENTTYSCCHEMTGPLSVETSIPIGRPIANTQVYILDANLNPVPVGVVGELYIGGDGLALGYLNQPDLTSQKFIAHPFTERLGSLNNHKEARVYKTGDMGCYRHDGLIEFHGRVDLQVKVRGHRVELEEVEAGIRQHPEIQDVVVDIKNISRKRSAVHNATAQIKEMGLVAYIVPVDGVAVISNADLHSFLKRKLPSHMIPAHTIVLKELPRLPSAKVDRQALPAPDRAKLNGPKLLRSPRNPIEESIVDIWREVLSLDEIGVDENFFDLGGHSLLGIQVLSRVKRVFNVELPVRCLFESPTLEGFASRVIEAQQKEHKVIEAPIIPIPQGGEPSLSFTQERIWFLSQFDQTGTAYSLPLAVRITGPLKKKILEACINEIFRRHEVLRTTVETRNGRPIPLIHPFEETQISCVDLYDLKVESREREFRRRANQEVTRSFDLACGPLVRVTLFGFHSRDHVLLVNMHHIITDTWSLSLFFQELEVLYTAFSAGASSPLSELEFQYTDFAHWQRQCLRGDVLDAQLGFWMKCLANAQTVLQLPTDFPRPVRQTFRGAREVLKLPSHLIEQIMALCRQEGVTLFMVLIAVFKILLFRYTGQDDLLVGTPVANRRGLDTERLMGVFVNTLVLRTDLSNDPTVRSLLGRVKDRTLEAYANQDVPFEQLVEALQPQRDPSRTPLFQVMFSMPNVPMPKLRLKDLGVEVVPLERGGSQFDLTMYIPEIPGQGHVVMMEYNADLFKADTIKRMNAHYQTLLENVVANPDHHIGILPMITEPERQQMQVEWNDTFVEYPNYQCLHHMVESQVENTPDAVAVVCDGVRLTYRELNQRANQVAHYLRKLGVASESLVGIFLDRSVTMLIGVLGVLKAGGAYVPFDPAYPEGRLRVMLEDSRIAVVLAQDHLLQLIPHFPLRSNGSSRSYGGPLVLNMSSVEFTRESTGNPNIPISSTNLSYVIYTSGSTGHPKGVMIPHRAVVNFMHAMIREPGLGPDDQMLAVTSLSFDMSVLELFLPLVVGAQVLVANRETGLDGVKLCRLLDESDATVMQGTPATWRLLFQAGWQPRRGFRVLCGGERLSPVLANQLLEQGVELWNLYGPTETTTYSTAHRVSHGETEVPIGHPIANTQLYVLDQCHQQVPIGVPGELYIGGDGLARGYVNQQALTKEKFIPDPFRGTPLAKLYQTGDLVKYQPDGTLEFLGRLDHQVKIRGYRIELGEVETVLNTHPAVQHSIVVALDRGNENLGEDKILVAYIVPTDMAMVDVSAINPEMNVDLQASCISELRDVLRKSLPDYMVPSSIIFLEAFPLTTNGKIDRAGLPNPEESEVSRVGFRAANTLLEKQLVEIWKKVLGAQRVGVSDDFFELGGHSLLTGQVLAHIHEELGVDISLNTFFEQPTIEYMARHIEAMNWLSDSKSLDPCTMAADREDQLL